uniref:CCT domain-containing protein n=1 Tax=Solanum lycopersicum TaxID=4081 RepID=A0A3Q7HJA9_SOLLC
MAFTPHDHDYYTTQGLFSNEFINSSLVTTNPLPQICNSQISPYEHEQVVMNINSLDHYVPPSISMMPWFPERLGVSDMTVPVLPPASSTTYAVENNNNNKGCIGQHHEGCESWDETTDHSFESNFWSSCPLATSNNWGSQRETSPKIKGTPSMKIGRYSEEERKDRILRYLKKRNQRNFNKTIQYACRKTLADKRVRVRGRFAKNNEDHQLLINGNIVNYHQHKDVCYDQIQMKHGDHYNEDNWLEEAITNFMYIPCSSYEGNFIS